MMDDEVLTNYGKEKFLVMDSFMFLTKQAKLTAR